MTNTTKVCWGLKDHLRLLPDELVLNLEREFKKLHQQYFLGKWEPSQLNGGKFAETVLRIVEFRDKGIFTPLDSQLNRKGVINSAVQNTNLDSSLRLQIPTIADLLLDFRNRRSVAHLGKIDVNGMDAMFVVQSANWVVAELIRLEAQIAPEEAQKEITKIIERKIPVVEEIGGRLKILDPKLSTKHQILVICYQKYPKALSESILFSWVAGKNKTRFKRYLSELDKEKLIDYYGGKARLTKRGLLWVEENIKFELEL